MIRENHGVHLNIFNVVELSQRTRDNLTLLISANCSRVKEDGQPPFSYQNLSPYLKLWNCLPTMQAKVGPTMEPGRGLSVTPAVHKSISSGDSYSSLYPFTEWLAITPPMSSQFFMGLSPHHSLHLL